MARLPEYIGPAALGIKMGVIVPGMDLTAEITACVKRCAEDDLIDNGDILCITESIVARCQNNFVTLDQIAEEIEQKLKLKPSSSVGVVFPILSRNRFALILQAIARAVPQGRVVVQLSWPTDEVGNQAVPGNVTAELGKSYYDKITEAELAGYNLQHPVTKVDYIRLYRETIESEGAQAEIFLANDPAAIAEYTLDGVIAADVHGREQTKKALSRVVSNLITLQDICSDSSSEAWSEWGLLGSNMSAGDKLKLAPRAGLEFALKLQAEVKKAVGKHVEVIIYGDGAYKDPSTGIYELADPLPVFGATSGFEGVMREGIKYKYIADMGYEEGKTIAEIEAELEELKQREHEQTDNAAEGTTPRRLADVTASLADLVSGSADAGTPLVLVKGFLSPEKDQG